MPSYFFEEGHRAVLHVQDPDEVNHEPQQAAKLRDLGLQRRPVLGDGNCYYYAAAHQLGKLSPDSFDTCSQTRNGIGSYLRSNPNLWQTDIEKLVNHRTNDKGPMSMLEYNMTIKNRVGRDKEWADDDIVVAATAVLYQRDIVILYCGASLAIRTQASGISRNGSPVFGFRMYVPWTTLLPCCLEHSPMILLYNGGGYSRGTHFDSTEPLMPRTQMPRPARSNTPSHFAEGFQTTGPQHNSVTQNSDFTWHTSFTKVRPLSFGVAPTPTTNSFATLENLREDGASE